MVCLISLVYACFFVAMLWVGRSHCCGHVVGGKESLLSSVNVLQPQLCLDNWLSIAPFTLNLSHRECYCVLSAVPADIRAECYYSNIHSHLYLHWWSCHYCLLDSEQQCSDWGQSSQHHFSSTDRFRKCHLHSHTDSDWETDGRGSPTTPTLALFLTKELILNTMTKDLGWYWRTYSF